jgi:hypothetical protein
LLELNCQDITEILLKVVLNTITPIELNKSYISATKRTLFYANTDTKLVFSIINNKFKNIQQPMSYKTKLHID